MGRNFRGFSLIEVLVSILILGVGLLGIAALQGNAVRFNDSAHFRSIALMQINNIVERMMANPVGVDGGAYNNVSGIPSLSACAPCTSAQIVQNDIHEWNSTNQALLPLGQGTIQKNGNKFTITVRWDNERKAATGLNCSGNTAVDLTCLTMEVIL